VSRYHSHFPDRSHDPSRFPSFPHAVTCGVCCLCLCLPLSHISILILFVFIDAQHFTVSLTGVVRSPNFLLPPPGLVIQ
jgi:hypothetical protein